LRIKNNEGKLNNIEVVRLKDKLGTRQLPTAELVLKGTLGQRISEIGKGVK
jgi:alkylation response protein AidB-like acyl-CoA dehydrogenase